MYLLLFALCCIAPAYAQQAFKKQKTNHIAQITSDDIALRPGSDLAQLFNEQATQQLLDAIAEDDSKKADDALQQNADPNALYEPRTISDGCAVPLLHTAIRKGQIEIVKLLVRAPGIRLNEMPQLDRYNELERKGLVATYDAYDYTEQYFAPLTLAASCGRYAYSNTIPSREKFNGIVTILLAAGADVEAAYGFTSLMHACQSGAAPIAEQLLKKGAKKTSTPSIVNEMSFAIVALSEECVDLLLQAGTEVHDVHFSEAFATLKEQRKSVYVNRGLCVPELESLVKKREKVLWDIIKNLVRYESKQPHVSALSKDHLEKFAVIRNEVVEENKAKHSLAGNELNSHLPKVLIPLIQQYFFMNSEEQVAATLNDVISEVEYNVNAMEDETANTTLMIPNNNH